MSVQPLRTKLPDGRARCQARLSWGSTWVVGREQCSKAALDGDVHCGTHKRQADARLKRIQERNK
jgi:hypothetical protein